jgi:cytochrome b6-f complex iron-sulfur subunit
MDEKGMDEKGINEPEPGVDRRRFLGYAWKGLGAALVVEAGWTTYDILNPRPSGAFGGTISGGPVSDYAKNDTVHYFQDGRFYLAASDGELVALYQKCPHLGCKVDFCTSSGLFECPCHGSVYNVRGEYLHGPAPRGMDRFRLRIQGDQVLVDTGEVVEGPPRGVSSVSGEAKGPSCFGGGEPAATASESPSMSGETP